MQNMKVLSLYMSILAGQHTAVTVALATQARKRLHVTLCGGSFGCSGGGALALDDCAVSRRDARRQVDVRPERAVRVASGVARHERLQAVHWKPRIFGLLALFIACAARRRTVMRRCASSRTSYTLLSCNPATAAPLPNEEQWQANTKKSCRCRHTAQDTHTCRQAAGMLVSATDASGLRPGAHPQS